MATTATQQQLSKRVKPDNENAIVAACAKLSLQNQKDCPLLRLPGELRNHIYGYVFEVERVRICHNADSCRACARDLKQDPSTDKYNLNEIGGIGDDVFQFITSVLSKAQSQSIVSVRTFDIRYDMDEPNERCTVDRLDPRACTLLRTLAQIKTLKRIVIYEGGWYNPEEFEESFSATDT